MARTRSPRGGAKSDTAGGEVTAAMIENYGVDCPVPPAVWRRFTAPDVEVDLILELREGASRVLVGWALLAVLGTEQGPPDVIMLSSFVAVSATLAELVAGVLPMTRWQPLLSKTGKLTRADIEEELAAIDAEGRLRGREGWEAQDVGRFRWLVTQLRRALGTDATPDALVALFKAAAATAEQSESCPIHTVGVNRPVTPAVCESRATVKADAADRVFNVDASAITWAVVDSGIDSANIAFRGKGDPGPSRVVRAFDVPRAVSELRQADPTKFVGLIDDRTWETFAQLADCGERPAVPSVDPVLRHHGTHVAGVLAGDERPHRKDDADALVGVCPTARLVDLRVFDENGRCEELWVLVALRFIRWMNATAFLRDRHIDGVNLSISTVYEVDAQACGWTPVCEAAERLVDAGVVVVAAAGNQAFDAADGTSSVGSGFRFLSITDPGNAESVITVGATDTRAPHRYGPIARSGRGPTADGRHKPDLLAPGYLITGPTYEGEPQQMTGTSQAAPHVSGVAAMLLARFPELRGQPRRVKQILRDSATDLGRLEDFQGAGLVDALRALQRP